MAWPSERKGKGEGSRVPPPARVVATPGLSAAEHHRGQQGAVIEAAARARQVGCGAAHAKRDQDARLQNHGLDDSGAWRGSRAGGVGNQPGCQAGPSAGPPADVPLLLSATPPPPPNASPTLACCWLLPTPSRSQSRQINSGCRTGRETGGRGGGGGEPLRGRRRPGTMSRRLAPDQPAARWPGEVSQQLGEGRVRGEDAPNGSRQTKQTSKQIKNAKNGGGFFVVVVHLACSTA